jgi:hypothetical protein
MREGLELAIECYELSDQMINVAPVNLSPDKSDERDFEELSDKEKAYLVKILHEQLGVDPSEEKHPVTSYEIEAPKSQDPEKHPEGWQGTAIVNVFETGRTDEDMFLHELNYPDGKREYFVAPRQTQL